MPLPKNAKRWSLNDKQFVQNKSSNQRVTYRQVGGSHYRGITLSPSQFKEMDKIIVEKGKAKYFVHELGDGIFFAHPREGVFTLWKQSSKNPKVDVAFFRFDYPTWDYYLKDVHNEIKSLLYQDAQE